MKRVYILPSLPWKCSQILHWWLNFCVQYLHVNFFESANYFQQKRLKVPWELPTFPKQVMIEENYWEQFSNVFLVSSQKLIKSFSNNFLPLNNPENVEWPSHYWTVPVLFLRHNKDILTVYCGTYTRLFTSELFVIAKIRNDFNVYLKGIG